MGATADASTTSTLDYNAGAPAGGAKITATVTAVTPAADESPSATNNWTEALNDLTLSVAASGMSEGEGTAAATAISFSKSSVSEADLVTAITANEVVTGKSISYTLGGTAPSTPVDATVEIRFAITDADDD